MSACIPMLTIEQIIQTPYPPLYPPTQPYTTHPYPTPPQPTSPHRHPPTLHLPLFHSLPPPDP
ncbi:hypothetical protein K491DRAFT_688256 [Lophiostoma macrostomum CBS 122681]|uniref:Uncharacterized protein n=1 Tax=Lophiostoma macrostomum CBS 122681 TaxID=1314788 RepID=A0A6A6TNH7_9PLEO|nr:hypothetical protein K491DRAFT_688256 [Lophiostoma macrostomum CBS 122681]